MRIRALTSRGALSYVGLLAALTCAPALGAQTRHASELAIGAVMNSPLGASGSTFIRVGVAERDRNVTARLGLEAIVHGRTELGAPFPARALAGAGYDLRFRPTPDGPVTHLLAGAGLYRTVGVKAGAYSAWLFAPRVGASYAHDFARVQLGAEIALQYVALSNFGAARGRAKQAFVPVVMAARF